MLIGRQRQAETLSEALDSARAGRSAVVCIHGQPGGGKTELLRSAIEDADGMRVLRADGHVAESDLPYAGLHQLIAPLKTQIEQIPVIQQTALRQVLGEYDGEPPDRMAVATAVLSLVTTLTESGPVLIAVDDFGWLDASTQKLLIFVCRRLDADAVVVVLSARSVHAELVRGLGTTVEADSLTADDARALVRHAWPGLGSFVTERIVEHAAGLPLALMEMPAELSADQRAGRAPLPSIMPAGRSLRSLYASRLGDLNNGTREALLIASFDHLGPDELAEALRRRDRGLSDLAPAERVRLVRVLDGVCDFTHPSVRSLVQSAAPASELATAHATLAEVFRDEPTRYATHAHGAAVATDTDVARALEVSARESERRGAYDEAAYHWELAARRYADPASVRSCRDAAVDSYLRVGIGPQTLVLLEQLCRDAESDVERARWRATEVDIRGWSDASSPADVADVVALGRTLAASPEPAERAAGTNLTVSLAGAQLAWGDYGAAAELVGVIRQAATDPMPVEPRLLCDVIDAMRGTSRGEALRGPWLDETDDAQLADASMFLSYVGVILGWLDETEMSRRVAERLRILVVERGGYATAALPLGLFNAQMMQHAGEWDRAYLEYAAAERLAQDADFVGPRALIALRYAYLAAARGDAATCHAARERVRVGAGSTMTSTQHLETCAVGLLHLSLGEYPDAADVLGRAARIERTMSSVISGYTTRFPDQYAAYWQLGRADELRDDLDEYTAAAHRLAHPTMAATGARCRALSVPENEIDAAFDAAMDLHRRSPSVFEAARTRLRWGQRLRRARRKADARAQLSEARAVFARLNASTWQALAESELAACGERSAARSLGATGPLATLTPREFEVAREVASGASNPEAAERLFISRRTVGYHLSSVFRKLDIDDRHRLSAFFRTAESDPQ